MKLEFKLRTVAWRVEFEDGTYCSVLAQTAGDAALTAAMYIGQRPTVVEGPWEPNKTTAYINA